MTGKKALGGIMMSVPFLAVLGFIAVVAWEALAALVVIGAVIVCGVIGAVLWEEN